MTIARTLVFALAAACASAALAGPLTPPGAPAPTMKTLDQVEPRVPIGQADVPFTITQAGSYYLTENLYPTALNQPAIITVKAGDVTLDLKGFRIQGATEVSTALVGVAIDSNVENVTVRDGTITLCQQDGVDAQLTNLVRLESLRLIANVSEGASLGSRTTVINSVFHNNGGRGLSILGHGGTVVDSVAEANGIHGFDGGASTAFENCTSSLNQGFGFLVGAGSSAANCTAFDNVGDGFFAVGALLNGCASYRNDASGFRTIEDVTFINCTAQMNVGHGFDFGGGNSLRDCASNQNGLDGFFTDNDDSRIEGCNARANGDDGYDIQGTTNLIVRNSAASNAGSSFFFNAGNVWGPIVNAATIGAATNPHANYNQ